MLRFWLIVASLLLSEWTCYCHLLTYFIEILHIFHLSSLFFCVKCSIIRDLKGWRDDFGTRTLPLCSDSIARWVLVCGCGCVVIA